MSSKVLFLTHRAEVHQKHAARDAPPSLDLAMLRLPEREAELGAALKDAAVIISERDVPIPRSMIEAAPKLRLILRLGSLSHDIDLEAAKRAGVRVSRQPVAASIFAAEHVMSLVLALLRRLRCAMVYKPSELPPRRTTENIFAFDWAEMKSVSSLAAKRILILGLGEIGVEVARRLRPFSVEQIDYTKRRRLPDAIEDQLGLSHVLDADEALRAADIVISLLPYAPDTTNYLDDHRLARMKPGALLVHAGSGGIVDEEALARALRARSIGGAALDTYTVEPLPEDQVLVALSRQADLNLILTPHIASLPLPANRSDDFSEIVRFFAGQPLRFEI